MGFIYYCYYYESLYFLFLLTLSGESRYQKGKTVTETEWGLYSAVMAVSYNMQLFKGILSVEDTNRYLEKHSRRGFAIFLFVLFILLPFFFFFDGLMCRLGGRKSSWERITITELYRQIPVSEAKALAGP